MLHFEAEPILSLYVQSLLEPNFQVSITRNRDYAIGSGGWEDNECGLDEGYDNDQSSKVFVSWLVKIQEALGIKLLHTVSLLCLITAVTYCSSRFGSFTPLYLLFYSLSKISFHVIWFSCSQGWWVYKFFGSHINGLYDLCWSLASIPLN